LTGALYLTHTLQLTGALYLTHSLQLTGALYLTHSLQLTGTLYLTHNLQLTGALYFYQLMLHLSIIIALKSCCLKFHFPDESYQHKTIKIICENKDF
jgi:hypothetical protein